MKKGSLGGLGGRRSSKNVISTPVNWPYFMAEQMRNIPPVIGSGPESQGAVPPPLPGQLGQLSNSVDDYLKRIMATSKGPQHPFARYVLPNPDQPYYDPTYQWDLQHRFSAPPDYRHESGFLRPDTPRQPSLQDRLPPGWTTEGPWRQDRAPPSSMAERMLQEEGLPAAIPGGPPALNYEREQLAPRAYPQPIGTRRKKPQRPKPRESEV